MSLFEAQVSELTERLSKEPARELELEGVSAFPAGKSAGLILQSSAYCELGAPDTDSAQILLYSSEAKPDCVKLIGAGPEEIQGKSVPFALAAVIRGAALDAEAYYRFVQRFQRLFDHPGWMVKSAKGKIWVRPAVTGGRAPDFAEAAATLISRVKAAFPEVTGVELWFVCGCGELVKELGQTAEAQVEKARGVKEGVWKERGFDYKSCQLAGHCGSCSDKKTCASVRKIEARVNLRRRKESEAQAAA